MSGKTVTCKVCGQRYAWKQSLNRHLKEIHKLNSKYNSFAPENYTHLNSEKGNTPILPPGIPDVEFRKLLENGSVEEDNSKTRFVFKHPFSMIVSGPTRSGKTQWVTRLLLDKGKRIQPTPNSIFYCYTHWQPKYDVLESKFPNDIRFHKGLPTSILINQLQDAIVVIDDLMDLAMPDKMREVITRI